MSSPIPIPSAQVLLVDDEVEHAEVMAEALRRLGHVCTLVHGLDDAVEEIRHGQFDLVVTDLVMLNDTDGMKVLEAARRDQLNSETIMVTAHGDVATAKAALRGGAFDFIEKPLDLELFRHLCQNAVQAVNLRAQNDELRREVDEKFGLEGIIGASPAIGRVITTIRQVAPTDIPVLITGESGTGKELVARAIHQYSKRAKRHFKPLNCAGLSESILESELFGHVKGAFTNADRDREGVFEYADKGTLLLDEIGDMPSVMQAKLLRALESGEIVRVGANEPRHVDVRFLSATNHDLQQLIEQGVFREDLYFRIRGAHIHLPALRDRREDIPLLIRHYADQFAAELGKPIQGVADDAAKALMQYDWPGNVRELINIVQNMIIITDSPTLAMQHVPPQVRESAQGETPAQGVDSLTGLSLDQIEKHAIRNALRACAGNREQAAKMLGIGERTMYRKLKEYGLK